MVKTIKGLKKSLSAHSLRMYALSRKHYTLILKRNDLVTAGKYGTKAFKNAVKRQDKMYKKYLKELTKVNSLQKQLGTLTLKKMREHNKKSLSERKRALKRKK